MLVRIQTVQERHPRPKEAACDGQTAGAIGDTALQAARRHREQLDEDIAAVLDHIDSVLATDAETT